MLGGRFALLNLPNDLLFVLFRLSRDQQAALAIDRLRFVNPKTCSAPWFQLVIRPSNAWLKIASSEFCTMAANRARASSVRARSLATRKIVGAIHHEQRHEHHKDTCQNQTAGAGKRNRCAEESEFEFRLVKALL